MSDHTTDIYNWLNCATGLYDPLITVSENPIKLRSDGIHSEFIYCTHPTITDFSAYIHSYKERWELRIDASSEESIQNITSSLLQMCNSFNRKDAITFSKTLFLGYLKGQEYEYLLPSTLTINDESNEGIMKGYWPGSSIPYIPPTPGNGYMMQFEHNPNSLSLISATVVLNDINYKDNCDVRLLDLDDFATGAITTLQTKTTTDVGTNYNWTFTDFSIAHTHAVFFIHPNTGLGIIADLPVSPSIYETYTYVYPTGLVHTQIKPLQSDYQDHNRFQRTLQLEMEWWI